MRLFLTFSSLCLIASACKGPYVPGEADEVLGVSMGSVRNAIAVRVDSGRAPGWVSEDRWKQVRKVYARWNNAPLWLEPEGVKDRAAALLGALEQAPRHGLLTDAYPIDSIRRVLSEEQVKRGATPEALAEADVLMTAAFVGYASDMLTGQLDPKAVAQSWYIPQRRSEVDSALVRTLQSPSMEQGLAAMAPQEEGYARLTQELARYQQLVARGGWQSLDADASRAAIAARLAAEGFQADTADLATALRTYQERHGLDETGKFTAATRRALNVPAGERLRQIGINLERYRWLPRTLGTATCS